MLELINAYRVRGHLIADIDPLAHDAGAAPPGARPRDLRPDDLGPRPRVLDRAASRAATTCRCAKSSRVMRRVYCGKVGIEYRHISSPAEK